MPDFVDYFWSFYGPEGLYPLQGLTLNQARGVCLAVELLPGYGGGDSVDRERARDLAIQAFELGWS